MAHLTITATDVYDEVTHWAHTTLLGQLVTVVVIVVLALVARWVWHRFMRRTTAALTASQFSRKVASNTPGIDETAFERYRARADSVAGLITSVGTFVIFAIAVLVLLAQIGINVAPLLASAGVAGIAIGFGAQTIIRDFLSGVFMMFENQYAIGDVVTVNGITGTVESIGLRITQVRDAEGTIWYVTNGSVSELGNLSQGWSLATVDIPVAYGADPERVTTVLMGVARGMQTDEQWKATVLPDEPTVAVEAATAASVTYRVRLRTAPNQQLVVGRALRALALTALEGAGIPAPLASPTTTGAESPPPKGSAP